MENLKEKENIFWAVTNIIKDNSKILNFMDMVLIMIRIVKFKSKAIGLMAFSNNNEFSFEINWSILIKIILLLF